MSELAAPVARLGDPGVAVSALLPVVATFGLSAAPVILDDAQDALHVSAGAAAWILIGYTLAFGVATPAMGKLADVRGTRTLLLLGAVLLTIGSAACLAGAGLGLVIAGRVVQGVGAAASSTAGFTILSARKQGHDRTRRLAILTAGSSIALGTGAFVGSVVGAAGWRVVLCLPLSAGLVGLVAALYPGVRGEPTRPFDVVGGGLLTVVAAGSLIALQTSLDGVLALPLLALGATAAVAVLLVPHVRAHPEGFLPHAVLSRPRLRRRILVASALSGWSLGTLTLGPKLLTAARPDWSAMQVGVALLPVAAIAATVALSCARWPAGRRVEPLLATLGAVGVLAGLAATILGGVVGPVLAMASGTSGFAASQVTVLGRLPDLVPVPDVGIAVGTLSLAVVLGGAVGASLAVVSVAVAGPRASPALLAIMPLLGLGLAASAPR